MASGRGGKGKSGGVRNLFVLNSVPRQGGGSW